MLRSTIARPRSAPHIILSELITDFEDGDRLGWLHPSHGPFPDFAGVFIDESSGDKFEVLVWEDKTGWISAVQGDDYYHNGFPRSYRWWPNGHDFRKLHCSPHRGAVFDVEINGTNVAKEIAQASVHMVILTELAVRG
jgi:hypothetical protein